MIGLDTNVLARYSIVSWCMRLAALRDLLDERKNVSESRRLSDQIEAAVIVYGHSPGALPYDYA